MRDRSLSYPNPHAAASIGIAKDIREWGLQQCGVSQMAERISIDGTEVYPGLGMKLTLVMALAQSVELKIDGVRILLGRKKGERAAFLLHDVFLRLADVNMWRQHDGERLIPVAISRKKKVVHVRIENDVCDAGLDLWVRLNVGEPEIRLTRIEGTSVTTDS